MKGGSHDTYRCNCPSSALPFSSNNWMAEAGPKSGLLQAFNAQTTFLSGVISKYLYGIDP
jgi:hypothetical protein